jgi:hypothetical protein
MIVMSAGEKEGIRGDERTWKSKHAIHEEKWPIEGKQLWDQSLESATQILGQGNRIALVEIQAGGKISFYLSLSPLVDRPDCLTPSLLAHVELAHRSTQNQSKRQSMREIRKEESGQSTVGRPEHALYTCTNVEERGATRIVRRARDVKMGERSSKHVCANG